MSAQSSPENHRSDTLERERNHLLQQLEDWLEAPIIWLAFAWVVLLVSELLLGLTPLLSSVLTVIWAVFIFDFLLRFVVAPRKLLYLRRNWLTALSLFVPALRLFRISRFLTVLRATRGVRSLLLLRMVSSVNRGMVVLRRTMRRRGLAYVVALTALVLFVGAAGMYTFERDVAGTGLSTYGEALWWTAMLLTTIGSQYWPESPEGRVLCLMLAIYSLGILGYVTATLASFFIGQDTRSLAARAQAEDLSLLEKRLHDLREENQELHLQIRKTMRGRGEV